MIDKLIHEGNREDHYLDSDLVSPNPFGSLSVLSEYLGHGLLENKLFNAGIKRVLEVGVGYNFTGMKQLARLTRQGQPIFLDDNLLAIDSSLLADDNLKPQLGTYKDKFKREKISIEQLRDRIKTGTTPPFDLVMSEGVASLGWEIASPGPQDYKGIQKSLKTTLQAMKDCMNSGNPNALLMMTSKLEDEILLLSRQDFEEAGLEVVRFLQTNDKDWVEILQNEGIFPPKPDDSGYRLVICKRKQ